MSTAITNSAPEVPAAADNVINAMDKNFIEEVAKLHLAPGPTDPLDHIGAREWLETVYRPLPKTPKPTRCVRQPSVVTIQNVMVTYGHGESFNIRVYQPQIRGREDEDPTKPLPAVLAYHGGGWIHGRSELEDDVYRFMASETQSVIVGVDYRLAPEHPFPVPHDDSYEAMNHVVVNASRYGIDITRIALWGASAGGNLAAGVALRDAHEHNPTRICHVTLVAPALCPPSLAPAGLSVPSASYPHFTLQSKSNPFILTGAEELWEIYANGRENFSNPYVTPLLSEPAPNHCPMYVVVGGVDVLRDEGIAYAVVYRDAGIDVQLEIIPGAPHGMLAAIDAWVSKQFWRNQLRVLNVALHTAF